MIDVQPARPVGGLESIPLNQVQIDAVHYEDGPQLVFAGAGTGKTRVLTAKIAFLIERKGLMPNRIFAATFTNKAAREMQERIERLTGVPCKGLWIGTFHSMCARILRREAPSIGYDRSFTIYDRDDQIALMKKVLEACQIDERSMEPRQMLQAVSRFKNACTPPAQITAKAVSFYDREVARVYETYCAMLARLQAMDFDDLITNTVYLFKRNPDIVRRYQNSFDHVLVDEYQDTNTSQFFLVKSLVGDRGCIFVVGDDDQSIYGWRGANVENILTFDKAFPGTRVFKLEQNYRSTQSILEFAHAAIAENTNRADKKLWTSSTNKGEVVVTRYRNDQHEAESVCAGITRLKTSGVKAGDICVLFRTNAQSRSFEDALMRARIPYVIVGATSFYERKEVKDCLAYLRLLVNPMDDMSFSRIMNVPARGLGDKAYELLAGKVREAGRSMLQIITTCDCAFMGARAQNGVGELRTIFSLLSELKEQPEGTPDALLGHLLEISGYLKMLEAEHTEESQARLENIDELLNTLTRWSEQNQGRTLEDFLQEITLATDVDKWEQKGEAVNLMTLHCAKGLEFRAVFLVGLEDGLLPSRLNFEDPAKIEEERRLLYVGVTRARETLECSYAMQRMRFGSVLAMEPSRFVEAIPPQTYRYVDMCRIAPLPPPAPRASAVQSFPSRQAAAREQPVDDFSQDTVSFRIGQHVVHATHGQGRIVNLSGFGDELRLTILFNDGVRRKLMATFADLTSA